MYSVFQDGEFVTAKVYNGTRVFMRRFNDKQTAKKWAAKTWVKLWKNHR